MGNNLCCFENYKQNITDEERIVKREPNKQNSIKKSFTRSIFSKKETSTSLFEEKVTKLEIGQIAADMFGLDESSAAENEGYLQFMSTLFNQDDQLRFQVSFNKFKFQNFYYFVRIFK